MQALQPPDSFYLEAAKSLLELGDHSGARRELDRLKEAFRSHPDVLEVLWGVQAQSGQWESCLKTAEAIVVKTPERSSGWIKCSFVLHRLKRTQEALDTLFSVVEKFPEVAMIPYNLACYACQLNSFWEAERWLNTALEIGGDDYREMALGDRALKELWNKIQRRPSDPRL